MADGNKKTVEIYRAVVQIAILFNTAVQFLDDIADFYECIVGECSIRSLSAIFFATVAMLSGLTVVVTVKIANGRLLRVPALNFLSFG